MRQKGLFVRLSLALLMLATAGTAAAAFIPTPIAGVVFIAANTGPGGPNVASVSYDALAGVLSADADFGAPGSPASIGDPNLLVFPVQDIVGTFSLTATIDSTDTASGGTFSWVGQSTALGILAPVTLLAGSIEDAGRDNGLFQVSGPVTTVTPQLAGLFGPITSAVLNFVGVPPLNADFAVLTASESPDIYAIGATALPEPHGLLLLAAALASAARVVRVRGGRRA